MRLRLSLLLCCASAFAMRGAGELELLHTTTLRADTHHVQGIEIDGDRLWVTSVDKALHKGFLQEFRVSDGALVREVDVSRGTRFHPGGMTGDGASLWIAVAEYRKASSAVIQRRSKRTLELEVEFEVNDHIGCVAASRDELIGANWDSREFYVWDKTGKPLRKIENTTGNAYQDLKFAGTQLVGAGLLGRTGAAVDWLEYPSMQVARRIEVGRTDRGVWLANEAMAVHGDKLWLLPEDAPSRLFEFRWK